MEGESELLPNEVIDTSMETSQGPGYGVAPPSTPTGNQIIGPDMGVSVVGVSV